MENKYINLKELYKKYDFQIKEYDIKLLIEIGIVKGIINNSTIKVDKERFLMLHDFVFRTNLFSKYDYEKFEKLETKFNTYTDVYNTLIYFLNNAEQFAQIRDSNNIYSVKNDNANKEIEIYDLQDPKAQRIFNNRFKMLLNIVEGFQNELSKINNTFFAEVNILLKNKRNTIN